MEGLRKLAVNAKYIYSGCFRVSRGRERICCNPQHIDNDKNLDCCENKD